jgi:DNA polymerase
MTRLHLDYETASEVNLKKVGAYKYAAHPSTRPLMLGWAFDDEAPQLWFPDQGPMPRILHEGMVDPAVSKKAFNAAFERLITRHCVGIEIPTSSMTCTMVESYYLGFAGGLDATLKAVGLESKDKRGGQLINLFCSPAPKNHKARWYDKHNRPGEWDEFCEYCLQDVKVERQLWHWMQRFPLMHQWDHQQWQLDQRINDRGVRMDVELAESAIEVWDREKARLTAELKDMTGLPLVTRGPFLSWMEDHTGVVLDNLRKDYLATLLHKGELPDEAKPLVEIWAQKEAKATSKYTAIINAANDDGRARGMFQYKGASRTDRVGGRLIQLQNLKRPFVKPHEIDTLVNAIKCEDPGLLRMVYPRSVSEVLGGAIRHALRAEDGKCFAVCDLTSVESVVLGWISMCPEIDRTFRAGRDSYKTFASNYFGITYDEVTKEQRSFSKPPVLGCGFMLGWKGLIAYAEGYGVDMEMDEAKRAVDTFRGMYPEIPDFWKWIYDAVKYVTQSGQSCSGYRMTIERDADFLRIWLPSGRALSYYKPDVIRKEAPWSTPERVAMVDNFSYMGMNDKNQWVRIFAHAGGITENIVQSVAGDLLWSGISNAEAAGLDVVVHVHDEIAVEVDVMQGPAALATLEECMTRSPAWADGMWIGADGFLTRRYTKI